MAPIPFSCAGFEEMKTMLAPRREQDLRTLQHIRRSKATGFWDPSADSIPTQPPELLAGTLSERIFQVLLRAEFGLTE
ncbi:hypothetical protein ACF08N_36630 [Streptomyces sp. NPDC015127]|uniref:hypothetical protein n=1 Tax=Streptomyces sp. NPDC015127 TaxID=3364939 RepID=UPI0036FB2BE5